MAMPFDKTFQKAAQRWSTHAQFQAIFWDRVNKRTLEWHRYLHGARIHARPSIPPQQRRTAAVLWLEYNTWSIEQLASASCCHWRPDRAPNSAHLTGWRRTRFARFAIERTESNRWTRSWRGEKSPWRGARGSLQQVVDAAAPRRAGALGSWRLPRPHRSTSSIDCARHNEMFHLLAYTPTRNDFWCQEKFSSCSDKTFFSLSLEFFSSRKIFFLVARIFFLSQDFFLFVRYFFLPQEFLFFQQFSLRKKIHLC